MVKPQPSLSQRWYYIIFRKIEGGNSFVNIIIPCFSHVYGLHSVRNCVWRVLVRSELSGSNDWSQLCDLCIWLLSTITGIQTFDHLWCMNGSGTAERAVLSIGEAGISRLLLNFRKLHIRAVLMVPMVSRFEIWSIEMPWTVRACSTMPCSRSGRRTRIVRVF